MVVLLCFLCGGIIRCCVVQCTRGKRHGRVHRFAIHRYGIDIIVGIMGYRFIAHRGGSYDVLVGIFGTNCWDRSGEGDGCLWNYFVFIIHCAMMDSYHF